MQVHGAENCIAIRQVQVARSSCLFQSMTSSSQVRLKDRSQDPAFTYGAVRLVTATFVQRRNRSTKKKKKQTIPILGWFNFVIHSGVFTTKCTYNSYY